MSKRRLLSLMTAFFLVAAVCALYCQSLSVIPSSYRISVGERVALDKDPTPTTD